MISYREAVEKVLAEVPSSSAVRVPLAQSQGRILAEDIKIDTDLPAFRKSFMDGFAVRAADTAAAPTILEVIGESAAGRPFSGTLGSGQAVQVSTGAVVPDGADAVQMVEKTRPRPGGVEVLEPVSPGRHVAEPGSEVKKGAVVVERGQKLGPAHIGVLATAGHGSVSVYRPPEVSIIVTGDELVEAGQTPGAGQVRNSNGPMLEAQCRRAGLPVVSCRVVGDAKAATSAALKESLANARLVLFSGGVSMGDHDYVHRVLTEASLELYFHKVAVKPGKPILAAGNDRQMVFGLPGNPVSSFVTFELFVRPAVRAWCGQGASVPTPVGAVTAEPLSYSGDRLYFKPASTAVEGSGLVVRPVETAGSADLVGFSRCNSLLVLPPGLGRLEAGRQVEVLPLEEWI